MSDLFSSDFLIKSYVRPVNESIDDHKNMNFNAINYSAGDVQEALSWAEEAMRVIITPQPTLRELDDNWIKFNMQIKKHRRESDWKSEEIFGLNNQYHYEYLRSQLLKDDITQDDIDVEYQFTDDGIMESSINEVVQDSSSIDYNTIDYTPIDVDNAIEWSRLSGKPIVVPVSSLEDLNNLWDDFNGCHLKIRRESDWKSEEIFGITNQRHYEYLKSQFLKDDIDKVRPVDIEERVIHLGDNYLKRQRILCLNESIDLSTKTRELLKMVAKKNSTYEDAIISNTIDDITNEYIASNQNIKYDVVPGEDVPYYTPEEIIDDGIISPTIDMLEDGMSYEDWKNMYENSINGLGAPYNAKPWIHTLESLFNKLETVSDEEKEAIDKSILSLGWNPDITFSPENRVKAHKRLSLKLDGMNGSTEFVDLRGFTVSDDALTEGITDESNLLYPVYIVLEEGKSTFSKMIKGYSKSKYSHAAISFDPEMHKIYSYGIEGSKKGMIGGFIEEDISDKDPNSNMAIFAIFLKKDDWLKIKNRVEDFIKNVMKTSYAYSNLLLSYIFNIPIVNKDWKMVCSQFVDRVLKFADIDLTGKDSSKVLPADFERIAKENKKIYILFDGLVAKFKASRISKLVNKLTNKATPFKEFYLNQDPISLIYTTINCIRDISTLQEVVSLLDMNKLDSKTRKIYETMLVPCTYAEAYLLESKDIPFKFDKDGNLFIKNIKKRDYEQEYAKSHKLLKQYESSHNYDGMKYELSKLWMMNNVIEAKLHSKKFEELPSMAIETSAEAKARAKILNDFKHYLKIVLDNDSTFNFEEYYDASPFSDAAYKIDKTTMNYTGELIRSLLKHLI